MYKWDHCNPPDWAASNSFFISMYALMCVPFPSSPSSPSYSSIAISAASQGLDPVFCQCVARASNNSKKYHAFYPTCIKILPGPACKEPPDNVGGSAGHCPLQGGGHFIIIIFRRLVGIGALA